MDDDYPNLREIMAAGLGLTEALAYWNHMVNQPHISPEVFRSELASMSADRSALEAETPKQIH